MNWRDWKYLFLGSTCPIFNGPSSGGEWYRHLLFCVFPLMLAILNFYIFLNILHFSWTDSRSGCWSSVWSLCSVVLKVLWSRQVVASPSLFLLSCPPQCVSLCVSDPHTPARLPAPLPPVVSPVWSPLCRPMLGTTAAPRQPNDRLDRPACQPFCLLHHRNMDCVSQLKLNHRYKSVFPVGYDVFLVVQVRHGCDESPRLSCGELVRDFYSE